MKCFIRKVEFWKYLWGTLRILFIDELDPYCLPIPPERCLTTDDSSDDDEPEKVSIEVIDKQVFIYFLNTDKINKLVE